MRNSPRLVYSNSVSSGFSSFFHVVHVYFQQHGNTCTWLYLKYIGLSLLSKYKPIQTHENYSECDIVFRLCIDHSCSTRRGHPSSNPGSDISRCVLSIEGHIKVFTRAPQSKGVLTSFMNATEGRVVFTVVIWSCNRRRILM